MLESAPRLATALELNIERGAYFFVIYVRGAPFLLSNIIPNSFSSLLIARADQVYSFRGANSN